MRTVAMTRPAAAPAAASLEVVPIFLNTANWSAAEPGFGAGAPGWYREEGLVDPSVIHLQGAVQQTSSTSTNGSNPNLIGTLPPAACPDRDVYVIVHTFEGTYADLVINPSGQIFLIDPRPPAVQDYRFVSLECIIYEQFLPVPNLISVNTPTWSPNAGFASSPPPRTLMAPTTFTSRGRQHRHPLRVPMCSPPTFFPQYSPQTLPSTRSYTLRTGRTPTS